MQSWLARRVQLLHLSAAQAVTRHSPRAPHPQSPTRRARQGRAAVLEGKDGTIIAPTLESVLLVGELID